VESACHITWLCVLLQLLLLLHTLVYRVQHIQYLGPLKTSTTATDRVTS
jgi:hypothetical protein